jgi:hypothetical protein
MKTARTIQPTSLSETFENNDIEVREFYIAFPVNEKLIMNNGDTYEKV